MQIAHADPSHFSLPALKEKTMPKSPTETPAYGTPALRREIAQNLLDWFAIYQRDLPWRRSRDPYQIWVSEVMLQQTRVDTVIPYYDRWMTQFPTLQALAQAPDSAVLKAWEGLGYYSRARNLHSAAQEVQEAYGGTVPDDPARLAALKGLGPYTVGAILSIAFNRSAPAVDGNVMRVLSRLFEIEEDITRPATRKAMERLALDLIPPGQANSFNQALMELGALVCLPTAPKCDRCPAASACTAKRNGTAALLPIKRKAKPPRPVEMACVVLRHGDRVLISRRPSEGLLGGLWEFPSAERLKQETAHQTIHRLMADRFGLRVELEAPLCEVKHVFTHLIWHLKAFTATLPADTGGPMEEGGLRWVRPDALSNFAFGAAHQKVGAQIVG
jgi:A/G-specific adenine glycosylase